MKSFKLTAVVIILLFGTEVLAECKEDTDCKHDKLCFDGVCKNPSSHTQPPPSDGIDSWFRWYVEISAVASVYAWGEMESTAIYYHGPPALPGEDTASVNGSFAPGLRIAAHFASSKFIHFGCYLGFKGGTGNIKPDLPASLSWIPNENKSTILRTGFGVSGKFGFRATNSIFMGLEIDAGLHLFSIPTWDDDYVFDSHTFRGLEVVPKLVFDFMVLNSGKRKSAVSVTLGVVLVPFSEAVLKRAMGYAASMFVEDEEGNVQEYELEILKLSLRHISPVLSVGFSFGG